MTWATAWAVSGEEYHLHRAEGLLLAIADSLRGRVEYGEVIAELVSVIE